MMRNMRRHALLHRAIAGVLLVLLTGCLATVETVSDAEIDGALHAGTLQALYQKARLELQENPKNKVLIENVRKIRFALDMQRRFDEFRATLDRLRTNEDVVPVIVMAADGGEFAAGTNVDTLLEKKIQGLSPANALHQKALLLLRTEVEKREDLLLEKTGRLNELGAEAIDDRLALIDGIYSLDGDADSRASERDAALEAASRQAYSWLHAGQFEKAMKLFETLAEAEPELPGISEGLAQAGFKSRLVVLDRLREEGDVENLYSSFIDLASDPTSQEFVAELRPTAEELASYFNLVAQSSLSVGALLEAYRNLQKIAQIAALVDLPDDDSSAEQDFISQIFVLAEEAQAGRRLGMAMAYLKVIEEFDTLYSEVARTLRDVRSDLYDEAVVKVAAFPFESPINAPGLGSLITATLVRHFVDTGHKDIRVLERQALGDVLKEQQLRALVEEREVNLTASDFLIQGAVLEASVDTAKQEIRIKKRVVVDAETVSNPKYEQWSRLTPKQRKQANLTLPSRFVTRELKEDITSSQTNHVKTGGIIANYRIIDAVDGALIHTNNLSSEASFEDDSVEGIEIGRFVQKAKAADLPADKEILRDLARSVAADIAAEIAGKLERPELRYLERAGQQRADEKPAAAVEALGKAIAILEVKNLPAQEHVGELKQLVLQLR